MFLQIYVYKLQVRLTMLFHSRLIKCKNNHVHTQFTSSISFFKTICKYIVMVLFMHALHTHIWIDFLI